MFVFFPAGGIQRRLIKTDNNYQPFATMQISHSSIVNVSLDKDFPSPPDWIHYAVEKCKHGPITTNLLLRK